MTPENLHACTADAAAAIMAGNRLIGRLNVESAIGTDSETIDTWLMYAWTADAPAGAQLAIERAIQMDPENPLAVAGKTWIDGVQALAERQVRERDQWDTEQVALEEAAEALAGEDGTCDEDEECTAEQDANDAPSTDVESEEESTEVETETEVEAETETEVEAETEPEVEAETETEVEAETETEVEAETETEVEAETETEVEAEGSVQAEADADTNTEPELTEDNSLEAGLSAALIAGAVATVASQATEQEAVETIEPVKPVSSLADDIRDSLQATTENVGPSATQPEEVVADVVEVAIDSTSTPVPEPEIESVSSESIQEVSDVEVAKEIEQSVIQDLEEMAVSVSEAVKPVAAVAPAQEAVEATPVEQPVAQTPTAEATRDPAEARSAVVMIVDDSPTIRKLVSMTLSRNGFDVIAAKDGVDALKLLTQQRPDIILTDINMPRLGGYKLCRFVKKQPKTKLIPVVMLSGKDGVFDKMKGKMAGANGYITKPFESADLVHQVRQQLLAAAGV